MKSLVWQPDSWVITDDQQAGGPREYHFTPPMADITAKMVGCTTHIDLTPYVALAREQVTLLAARMHADRRANPRPLPIDGHAYHRRTRARRRRA